MILTEWCSIPSGEEVDFVSIMSLTLMSWMDYSIQQTLVCGKLLFHFTERESYGGKFAGHFSEKKLYATF